MKRLIILLLLTTISVFSQELYNKKHYYEDGSIKCDHYYSKGKGLLHGETIYYYESGSIESKGKYIDGDKEDEWFGYLFLRYK